MKYSWSAHLCSAILCILIATMLRPLNFVSVVSGIIGGFQLALAIGLYFATRCELEDADRVSE